ncbi:hypothetical protein AAFN88_00320 [Pelagibius sp. CAU 1746]|uniref:hypothetical protein n=1 Tax=Pelagibius sp. CAU 1746 TaxID=3140370 RepID=UPI00325BEFF6
MASLILARLLGPLFLIAGLGLLLNRAHYRRMLESFLNDPALYYFSGALALVAGLAIVTFHNIWTADWRVVITLVGWLSVAKGVVRLLFPQAGSRLAGPVLSPAALPAMALLVAALGAWLCFVGYLAAPTAGLTF